MTLDRQQRLCDRSPFAPRPVLLTLALVTVGLARAQMPLNVTGAEPTRSITVSGTGETLARPNIVELDLRLAGQAELAGDAIGKFRESRQRTTEAFQSVKIKDLTIEPLDVAISNVDPSAMQRYYGGMPNNQSTKMKSEVRTTLRVRIANIEKMTEDQVSELVGRLMDTAKDSGVALGPSQDEQQMAWRYGRMPSNTAARFVLENFDEMREEAYSKAVADARSRAERLARLAGVKIVGIDSIQELSGPGDTAAQINPGYESVAFNPVPARLAPRIVSDTFGKISLKARLQVRFRIAPAEGPAASGQKEAGKDPTNRPAAKGS
jgi:uncharacterized protein YggE